MSPRGVEIDPRRERHAGVRQDVLAPRERIVRDVADVAPQIERTIRRRRRPQSEVRQASQQHLAIVGIPAHVAVEFRSGGLREGSDSGVLGDGRWADGEVLGQDLHRPPQARGDQRPAEAPPGHREVFADRTHDDRITRGLPGAGRRGAIGDAVIDLVADQEAVVGLTPRRDGGQFCRVDHRPGRVGWTGHDQATGDLGQRLQHRHRRLVFRLRAAVELQHRAAESGQRVAVCGIAGSGHRDRVTGLEGGEEQGGEDA